MKILTLCVPCNNNTLSIHSLVESVLIQEEFVEVLFILQQPNELLKSDIELWEKRYPNTVKIVTSNKDVLKNSTGLYFKLINPTTRIEPAGLVKVISTLKDLLRSQASLDLLVCDFEYKTNTKKRNINSYHQILNQEDIIEWHQIKSFNIKQHFNSKSIVYKTNLLIKNDFNFFYTNVYNDIALPIYILSYVKTILYTPVVFEVCIKDSKESFINAVDDGIYFAKEVINTIDISDIKSRKARAYVSNHINLLLLNIVKFLLDEGSIESLQKKEELWYYLKINNYVLYKQCKKMLTGKVIGIENTLITRQVIRHLIN